MINRMSLLKIDKSLCILKDPGEKQFSGIFFCILHIQINKALHHTKDILPCIPSILQDGIDRYVHDVHSVHDAHDAHDVRDGASHAQGTLDNLRSPIDHHTKGSLRTVRLATVIRQTHRSPEPPLYSLENLGTLPVKDCLHRIDGIPPSLSPPFFNKILYV